MAIPKGFRRDEIDGNPIYTRFMYLSELVKSVRQADNPEILIIVERDVPVAPWMKWRWNVYSYITDRRLGMGVSKTASAAGKSSIRYAMKLFRP